MTNLRSTPNNTVHKGHQKMCYRTVGNGRVVPNIRTINGWRTHIKMAKQIDEIESYMTAQNVTWPSE